MASAFRELQPRSSLEDNSSIRDQILTMTRNWQPECFGPAHKRDFELRVTGMDMM